MAAGSVPHSEAAGSPRRPRIEPPPRAVLEGARRREPAALEAFFDVYFAPLHAFAWRLLGDRTAAEDMTQEVFIKIHRALGTLDPGRDPWPWIATIARNACRDHWRSSSHRMDRRSDSLDADLAAAERLAAREAPPDTSLEAGERERIVREAIAGLPEAQRELVLLFDYEGLSHLQVAELLGISHAAARKRYSRALQMLGERLAGAGGGKRAAEAQR
jgi:RNA polymerase sigma-70 factor (ECF subfamily)